MIDPQYTEGIYGKDIVILEDGIVMTITSILQKLNELSYYKERTCLAEKALLTNEVQDFRNWQEWKKLEPKK